MLVAFLGLCSLGAIAGALWAKRLREPAGPMAFPTRYKALRQLNSLPRHWPQARPVQRDGYWVLEVAPGWFLQRDGRMAPGVPA